MKKENLNIISRTKSLTKNDTLVLYEHWLTGWFGKDTTGFDLAYELFKAVNKKKGTIIYKGKTITSFYTKKVKIKKAKKRYFKGIYYYDSTSKKHFLTNVLQDYPFIDHPELLPKNHGHILD